MVAHSFACSNGLVLLFLVVLFDAYIEIVPSAVATMTKASSIVKFVGVRTLGGVSLPTLQCITLLAHPFGVVLFLQMWTLRNLSSSSCFPDYLFLNIDAIFLSILALIERFHGCGGTMHL